MAALLALADLPDPEPIVAYRSEGQLLIIGPAGVTLDWAERLADELSVTVLVTAPEGGAELPLERRYQVYSGIKASVRGHPGAFEVAWEQANPIDLEACTRCGVRAGVSRAGDRLRVPDRAG
jgi:hypothetical protein